MKGNGTRSPDAIIADIEAIRSEMDSTLLAIEERLTPGQMIDQGLDYLRNSGGREFIGNLGDSLKTNPMPATLVGIGLAWLMITQQRASRPGLTGRVDYDRAGIRTAPGEYMGYTGGGDGESLREKAGDMKAKVGEMAGRASDAAATARDKVSDAMQSARDAAAGTAQRARDLASGARDMAAGAAQRTRDAYVRTAETARLQADRVSSGYRQMVQEQPLALGAIGLGLGVLLAALAPRTRHEDEWMGSTADSLKRSAVEAGHEQLNRAGDTMRSVMDEAHAAAEQVRGATSMDAQRDDGAARGSSLAASSRSTSAGSGSVPPLTGSNMARPTGAQAGGRLDE